MADRMNFGDIILFFVVQAHEELPVTKLMKLAFLADVEHQQLYGEPLSGEEWRFHSYGPFTQSVYEATEILEDEELIACTVRPAFTEMGRNYSSGSAQDESEARLKRLTPRARRALTNVLKRYGHLSVHQIKRVAYETETMKNARQGEQLDLTQEPRRAPIDRIPGLSKFMDRAPAPIVRDIGDPVESANEDLSILEELGQLRREANQKGR